MFSILIYIVLKAFIIVDLLGILDDSLHDKLKLTFGDVLDIIGEFLALLLIVAIIFQT